MGSPKFSLFLPKTPVVSTRIDNKPVEGRDMIYKHGWIKSTMYGMFDADGVLVSNGLYRGIGLYTGALGTTTNIIYNWVPYHYPTEYEDWIQVFMIYNKDGTVAIYSCGDSNMSVWGSYPYARTLCYDGRDLWFIEANGSTLQINNGMGTTYNTTAFGTLNDHSFSNVVRFYDSSTLYLVWSIGNYLVCWNDTTVSFDYLTDWTSGVNISTGLSANFQIFIYC